MSPSKRKTPAAAEGARGLLAQHLDKPAASWTEEDLARLFEELEVQILSLMHVDGDGELRALDFLPRSPEHLHQILYAGERADGSSLFPNMGLRPDASDIVLRPRLSTAFVDPFSEIRTLAVLCEHRDRSGQPLPVSPDTIVRRAAERFQRETGSELLAHAEVEFFLGKQAEDDDVYGSDERGYHATSPFVFGEPIRRHAMVLLGDMGVDVKYGHAEVGYIGAEEGNGYVWEQHEIELALSSLPRAAEAVVLTKWVLRNVARAAGVQCSFRPVLRAGHAGSGMHFHFAALTPEGFAGLEGPSAEEARWLIGGLVQNGAALMAFGNRSRESFLRLRQGKEVPAEITWGPFNRKALVRIPLLARTPSGEPVAPPTVEFRLPDGSVEPYLLLAGAAQAMLQARTAKDLDAVLAASAVNGAADARAGAAPAPRGALPLSFGAIADALESDLATLAADGVFPSDMLRATVERLRSASA